MCAHGKSVQIKSSEADNTGKGQGFQARNDARKMADDSPGLWGVFAEAAGENRKAQWRRKPHGQARPTHQIMMTTIPRSNLT